MASTSLGLLARCGARVKRVTLVGTVHEKCGRASAVELHALLEALAPEVIFLELPADAYDRNFQVFRQTSLETDAASRFRRNHAVAFVPVDLQTPELSFFRNSETMFNTVEQASDNYCRLVDLHARRVWEDGFVYLNSEQCDDHWQAVYAELQCTIDGIGDASLSECFHSWSETNALREDAMIEAVERYCANDSFSRSALLVGAAHRRRMLERSATGANHIRSTVQSDFSVREP